MNDIVDDVAALIALNGGEVVGKTRLQKIFYLLEAMELGFDLDFDYKDFGPFSVELAFAADDAEALGLIESEERPGFHAVPYTIFRATASAPVFNDLDFSERCKSALEKMRGYSSLTLELAATAVFLRENGYPDDFWEEVRVRKAIKATPDRIKKANQLIKRLGL